MKNPADRFPREPELGSTDPNLARSLPVTTASGVNLVGWVVRQDTVVVSAGNLSADVTVTVDGKAVVATEIHESVMGVEGWHPVTALQLPEGTLPMVGEKFPPEILAKQNQNNSDEQSFGARKVAFWCIIFPRMRGC